MGWYGRVLFPWLMDMGMRDRPFDGYRKAVTAGLSGIGLEIGAGTGLNLPWYPSTVRELHVVDPNPGMDGRLKRRAEAVAFPVHHARLSAERLPYADGTFDFVVSTWTLCSIPDAGAALAEVRRVLKPQGEFRYVEHGTAPDASVRRWQRWLNPVQKRVADGCHLDRDIPKLVVDAGFALTEREEGYAVSVGRPYGYFYRGRAVNG